MLLLVIPSCDEEEENEWKEKSYQENNFSSLWKLIKSFCDITKAPAPKVQKKDYDKHEQFFEENGKKGEKNLNIQRTHCVGETTKNFQKFSYFSFIPDFPYTSVSLFMNGRKNWKHFA